jgi:outer membrane protein assembly factor BamA
MLTIQRRFQITDDDLIETRPVGRENVGSVSFVRDITQGRYLQTVAGYRLLASYQESHPGLASELTYHNAFLDYHQFLPLHKESSIALRTFGGGSFGEDRQIFRAGGSDLLRGYGRFDARSSRSYFIATNLEVRFPLVFDLNYHVLFFFPDFLFKNIYGSIFTDNGILWNNQEEFVNYQLKDVRNSIGVGLRFETFVLQSFPLILRTDWAYRTTDGAHTFYLALGPNF